MQKYQLSYESAFERHVFSLLRILKISLNFSVDEVLVRNLFFDLMHFDLPILHGVFIHFRVKEKRRFVGPNSGFQSQLKLYHTMGWKLDASNPQFKLYRLHYAAYHVSKGVVFTFLFIRRLTLTEIHELYWWCWSPLQWKFCPHHSWI